jgi:23S rRNA (guanosine2251-2'-O)-methyltransferase
MRQSYRDKQNRRARIAKEKENKFADKKSNVKKSRKDNNQRPRRDERAFKEQRIEREETVQVEKEYEDIVAGRNAVLELLKSDKDINKIFVERGEKHGSINEIIARARENKVVLVEVEKSKLDLYAENHQGVVAIVPPFNYCEIEDILDLAKEREEDPFVLILDGIEDPHNLGAIIRTAETAGVHGIIIPKRRTAQVNATVAKVSAGATTYVKVARVNNIVDSIRKLKDAGLWVIGTDGDAETMYYNQDLKGPLAIVIGSEGFGMGKLVKENADILIKIPMKGEITSLNASVSAGIVIYEAVRQRM